MSKLFTTDWLNAQMAKRSAAIQKACDADSGPVEVEADLHSDIMAACRARGWKAFHGSMAESTRRTLGEPDFVILCDAGQLLLVEAKSRTGKPSKDQQLVHAHASRLGHTVHIVRSMKEFEKVCRSHLKTGPEFVSPTSNER